LDKYKKLFLQSSSFVLHSQQISFIVARISLQLIAALAFAVLASYLARLLVPARRAVATQSFITANQATAAMSNSASVDFHVKKSGQRGWASHGWLKVGI
jgi:hypothetical protein